MIEKYVVNAVKQPIHRHVFIQKMKTISAKKNIFITSPSGFGKSTAAEQFLSLVRGATSKLTSTVEFGNPSTFYKKLASELIKLVKIEKNLPNSDFTLKMLLDLLTKFPKRHSRCYLLIDDFHRMKNDEILNSLPLIVSRLPEYVRLCLAGRSVPTKALSETGLFEVLTQEDLRFSPEEVEWLGAEKDIPLKPEQIEELLKITDGWAVHLSMLISDGQIHKNPDKTPPALMQYLKTDVWDMWDNPTKELLLRLSVPDKLTPELCRKLTANPTGYGILENFSNKDNAFLFNDNDGEVYRFLPLFREFLQERISLLGDKEIKRLNEVTAKWHGERGEFAQSVKHYGKNLDFNGIYGCTRTYHHYSAVTASSAVEFRENIKQILDNNVTTDLIVKNPHLLFVCSAMECRNGNKEKFLGYIDIMRKNLSDFTAKYPDFTETFLFFLAWDFSVPLREYVKWLEKAVLVFPKPDLSSGARINSVTMYLPHFHRSFRDFSEYHELKPEDLQLTANTFGTLLGNHFKVMEKSLTAGIRYERGELLEAFHHASDGIRNCGGERHPELYFSSHMILTSILYSMGANVDADEVMNQTGIFIQEKAVFLEPNFKALQTKQSIDKGNKDSAKEWLEHHASFSNEKPDFEQLCQHFTTMRALNAVGDFSASIHLGNRLKVLVAGFNRPLDQIESGILLANALWRNGEKSRAAEQLKQSLNIALPYGFTQLFINEGKEILPLLCTLRERKGVSAKQKKFIETLTDQIYRRENRFNPEPGNPPKLTVMQRRILTFLEMGLSYGEIAAQTGTAHGTAKGHVLLLYKKLGVHNAEDAVIKGKMLGLLQ